MPKSLADVMAQLKDEQLPTAGQMLEDLPQFGGFAPPPQPGTFRFKLPTDLTGCFDLFEASDGQGRTKGQRVNLILDQHAPLLIVQSPQKRYDGEPFQTRLNNNERNRGKAGAGGQHSDLDYLLYAFEPGTPKPKNNAGYLERVKKFGGREFTADIRWSWGCSTDRNIRVPDASGQLQEVEKKGCGARYYQEDQKKDPSGEYPLQIRCTCGASLRAFGNLDNVRP